MQTSAQVKDIMQATREVVHVDENLLDASIRLRRARLPALAVVDGDEIVGLLTEAAIEKKAASPDNDLAASAARDLMSVRIGFCRENESLGSAKATMEEGDCSYLLVTGPDGKLRGLLSRERLTASGHGIDETSASGRQDKPHVVDTPGRAKGDKPHRPNNYSDTPKLPD